jgi:hypothetical protein
MFCWLRRVANRSKARAHPSEINHDDNNLVVVVIIIVVVVIVVVVG